MPSMPQIMRYNKYNCFDSMSRTDIGNKKVALHKYIITNVSISDQFNASAILISLKTVHSL